MVIFIFVKPIPYEFNWNPGSDSNKEKKWEIEPEGNETKKEKKDIKKIYKTKKAIIKKRNIKIGIKLNTTNTKIIIKTKIVEEEISTKQA